MKRSLMQVMAIASFTIFSFAALTLTSQTRAYAASATVLDSEAQTALADLYAKTPSAKLMGDKAKAILIFPKIVKGGFILGGQGGEGVLLEKGKSAGYYSSAGVSYGLQAGVQKFGYALFFMTDADLQYLHSSGGWEIGVGPSVVIVDEGIAKSLTTTTTKEGIYAFFFSQTGLMAGLGLQGTKISEFQPS